MIDVASVWRTARRAVHDALWRVENLRGIAGVEARGRDIEIRQNVVIVNAERLICPGPLRIEHGCFFHCGGNSWSNFQGEIRIGRGCWFSQNNVVYGAGGVEVGDHSGTGPNVMIFSSRDNYSMAHARKDLIVHHFGPVRIGSHVRIFSNVVVGPGITIGEGAVIGANSLVLRDIPPWVIAAGSPARVLRPRDKDSVDP